MAHLDPKIDIFHLPMSRYCHFVPRSREPTDPAPCITGYAFLNRGARGNCHIFSFVGKCSNLRSGATDSPAHLLTEGRQGQANDSHTHAIDPEK